MTTLNTIETILPIQPYFVFTYEPSIVAHMGVRFITSICAVAVSIIHVGLWNCHIVRVALEEIIAIHQLRYKSDSQKDLEEVNKI